MITDNPCVGVRQKTSMEQFELQEIEDVSSRHLFMLFVAGIPQQTQET